MQRTKKFLVGAALVAASFTAGGAIVGAVGGQGEPGPEVQGSGTASPDDRLLAGSTDTDDRYKAITPCRLVDTRQAGGTFSPTEFRNYRAVGTGGAFAAQGGKANGCGIPATATAIDITVTSVSATGTGFIRVYPAGAGEPTATFMNYGTNFNTSSSGTVKIKLGVGDNFRLRNYGSTSHVVVDVAGYTVPPAWASVAANGTYLKGSRVDATLRTSVGNYRVRFDKDVRNCSTVATGPAADSGANNVMVTAAFSSSAPGEIYVTTINSSGAFLDAPFTLQMEC